MVDTFWRKYNIIVTSQQFLYKIYSIKYL